MSGHRRVPAGPGAAVLGGRRAAAPAVPQARAAADAVAAGSRRGGDAVAAGSRWGGDVMAAGSRRGVELAPASRRGGDLAPGAGAPLDVAAGVAVIVPAGLEDPRRPSGGNRYDLRVCAALAGMGRPVRVLPVAGSWPAPSEPERSALGAVLAGLPAGSVTVLDGLVAGAVPEVLAAHAHRLRLVALVHLPLADEVGLEPDRIARLAELERRALAATRLVVATSPWTARRLVERYRVAPARVRVAPPGVDPAAPAPGTDGVSRLLCVGSVSPTKGQDVLVAALAAVERSALGRSGRRSLPDWRLDLVGPSRCDAAHLDALRHAIAERPLAARVRLTGPLAGAALDAAYARADLVVVPSRVESYGMVVTEALARGIPVLASSAGGLPDTLGRDRTGRRPGLLVAPDDPAALAVALRRWFDAPALRAELRRAARQRRDELDGWEVTARCLADAMCSL